MGILNKVTAFLRSSSGRKATGKVLDKAEQFATGKLGADKADQIRKARGMMEKGLGTGPAEGGRRNTAPPHQDRPATFNLDDRKRPRDHH